MQCNCLKYNYLIFRTPLNCIWIMIIIKWRIILIVQYFKTLKRLMNYYYVTEIKNGFLLSKKTLVTICVYLHLVLDT